MDAGPPDFIKNRQESPIRSTEHRRPDRLDPDLSAHLWPTTHESRRR
jgi:hypothetical protein